MWFHTACNMVFKLGDSATHHTASTPGRPTQTPSRAYTAATESREMRGIMEQLRYNGLAHSPATQTLVTLACETLPGSPRQGGAHGPDHPDDASTGGDG